jgi:methionyl aminopeptidase
VNDVAAHYTPSRDNDVLFRRGDVVKIDVGAHVDGYPGDTAATVEIGTRNHSALMACAQDALEMCIEMVAPGTSVASLGEAASRVITSAGFHPVENLTGHSMERYNLHAGISIPSVPTRDRAVIQEGMVLAIEPFSTTGRGKVSGRKQGSIFRIVRERKANPEVEAFFGEVKARFRGFPFAERWCYDLSPDAQALLQRLVRLGMIMSYPVLKEVGSGVVAQAEHSVLVTADGCKVLT